MRKQNKEFFDDYHEIRNKKIKKNMIFLHDTQHEKNKNSQRKLNYKWKNLYRIIEIIVNKNIFFWSNWMTLIWKARSLIIVSKNFVFDFSTTLKKLKSVSKSTSKIFSKKISKSKTKFLILTILQISKKTWFFLNDRWSWLCFFFSVILIAFWIFFAVFQFCFIIFSTVFILICFFFLFFSSSSEQRESTVLWNLKNKKMKFILFENR